MAKRKRNERRNGGAMVAIRNDILTLCFHTLLNFVTSPTQSSQFVVITAVAFRVQKYRQKPLKIFTEPLLVIPK